MKKTHRNYSEENGDFIRLARFFMTVGGAPRLFDLVPGQGRGLKIRVVRKQARLRLVLRRECPPVVRRVRRARWFCDLRVRRSACMDSKQ